MILRDVARLPVTYRDGAEAELEPESKSEPYVGKGQGEE